MKALEALKNALSSKISYKKDPTQMMLEHRKKTPKTEAIKKYEKAMTEGHADGRIRPFRAPEVMRINKTRRPI